MRKETYALGNETAWCVLSKVNIIYCCWGRASEGAWRGRRLKGRRGPAHDSYAVKLPFHPESKPGPPWGFKPINDTLSFAFSGGKVGLGDLSSNSNN